MNKDTADLIERLERATGPNRELDAAIYIRNYTSAYPDETEEVRIERARVCGPHYTSSIDAALTLVPVESGCPRFQCMYEGMLGAHAFIVGPSHKYASDLKVIGEGRVGWPNVHSYADAIKLLPIALCIASLRARDHKEG